MPQGRFREPVLVLLLIGLASLLDVRPALAAGGGPPVRRELASLARSVDQIEQLVVKADFQRAIARAEETRRWASDVPRSPDAMQTRARLEVLLCTAQIALGDASGARRSMQQAIYAWPLLSLDEMTTSPRVMKLFREVRGKGGAR